VEILNILIKGIPESEYDLVEEKIIQRGPVGSKV
jgi:hypothetical protein